jgi:hypothetical protein
MPPIGCHYIRERDAWEVTLFISPTEIVGGQHDGERISCLFLVDIVELLQVFDVVESASWQPHQVNEADELRSHVSVTGFSNGHMIWLRVLAESPERYDSGRYVNVIDQRLLDTWRG